MDKEFNYKTIVKSLTHTDKHSPPNRNVYSQLYIKNKKNI